MKIGMVCFPTFGGSSAVATELGLALAEKGHEIHFVGYEIPFRLKLDTTNIYFHRVEVIPYPVFRFPPYTLALASHLAEIIVKCELRIVHLHYAIPHAAAAYLARQLIQPYRVKIITTLHGTDIQLAALDPAYRNITNFSLNQSDAVTAVSRYLKEETEEKFNLVKPIEVIYNFINIEKYSRLAGVFNEGVREKIIIHISNFRSLKKVDNVVRIFARIAEKTPAKLWLVGDGPELKNVENLSRELGLRDQVEFMKEKREIVPLLSLADLFLLPSTSESFGLAALEAVTCGVPVIASRIGGLPEVIEDGIGGFLFPPDDLAGMSQKAGQLLNDPVLHEKVTKAGRVMATRKFNLEKIVLEYEALYQKTCGAN